MEPATMMGISAGVNLLGGLYGQSQARKSEEFWKDQLRARRSSPMAKDLQGIFQEDLRQLKRMPGAMARAREGRLSTQGARRLERFRRNLASSGDTGGSFRAMRGERDVAESLNAQRVSEQLAEQQALSAIRQRAGQTGRSLMDVMYPSAGQAAQGAMNEAAYYNPMNAVNAGLQAYAIGKAYQNPQQAMGTGSPTGVPGSYDPFANTGGANFDTFGVSMPSTNPMLDMQDEIARQTFDQQSNRTFIPGR